MLSPKELFSLAQEILINGKAMDVKSSVDKKYVLKEYKYYWKIAPLVFSIKIIINFVEYNVSKYGIDDQYFHVFKNNYHLVLCKNNEWNINYATNEKMFLNFQSIEDAINYVITTNNSTNVDNYINSCTDIYKKYAKFMLIYAKYDN